MELPKLNYNKELFAHIRDIRRDQKPYMMCDLEVLGSGATGTTYTAFVKPKERFNEPVVLKEQRRDRYCENEFEALKYLRDMMIEEKIPGYFVFMYGCFTSGGKKYIILEKVDYSLDAYMIEYNLSSELYYNIFYQIADAVSYLETNKFNHGDLWSENVMISWLPEQEHLSIDMRKFTIKFIDYDSAFKEKSSINTPTYGGADKYRTKFILGYDLNRFFDSLIYSYESYLEKKTKNKKQKIARLKKLQKKNKSIKVPALDDPDSSDDDFDKQNIIYPSDVIDFMYELKPKEPNHFDDTPTMAGEFVKNLLKEKL